MLALRWRAVVRLMKRAAAAAYAQARLAALHRTVNQRHHVKACKALMSQQRTLGPKHRQFAHLPANSTNVHERALASAHLRLVPRLALTPEEKSR